MPGIRFILITGDKSGKPVSQNLTFDILLSWLSVSMKFRVHYSFICMDFLLVISLFFDM